jgi:hypothetical protein
MALLDDNKICKPLLHKLSFFVTECLIILLRKFLKYKAHANRMKTEQDIVVTEFRI